MLSHLQLLLREKMKNRLSVSSPTVDICPKSGFNKQKLLKNQSLGYSKAILNEIIKLNPNCLCSVDTNSFEFKERDINKDFVVGYIGDENSDFWDYIVPVCKRANVPLIVQKNFGDSVDKTFYEIIDVILVVSDDTLYQLQAAFVGRMSILSIQNGTISDFIIQGVNGFCIRKNIDICAKKLLWLRNHREQCSIMGCEARKMLIQAIESNQAKEKVSNVVGAKAKVAEPIELIVPKPKPPVIIHKKKIMLYPHMPGWAYGLRCHALMEHLSLYYKLSQQINTDLSTYDLVYFPSFEILKKFPTYKHACTTIAGLVVKTFQEAVQLVNRVKAFAVPNLKWYHEFEKLFGHRVFYIPNGVDTKLFVPQVSHVQYNSEFVVGWVGNDNVRRYPIKRIDKIREICQQSNIKLVEQCKSYKVPHDKMPDFYNKIDLYINCSTTEGSNNPILEACSSGVPVLATNVGNIPDLVRSGVEPLKDDLSDLVSKIEMFKAMSQSQRNNIGLNLRQRMIVDFDWSLIALRYKEMFDYCLSDNGNKKFFINQACVKKEKEEKAALPKKIIPGKSKVLLAVTPTGWAYDLRCYALLKHLSIYYNLDKQDNRWGINRGKFYDLVYFSGFEALKRQTSCKKVCTTIGGMVNKSYEDIFRIAEKAMVLAIPNLKWFNDFKSFPDKRVFYIPNGVDTTSFTPRTKVEEDGEFVVGWVGNDREDRAKIKRINVLRGTCYKLGIKLIEQNWKHNQIDHNLMPNFYKKIDLYVSCSVTEGSSNTILEACSTGVPVLATNVGNVPELVESGITTLKDDLSDLEDKILMFKAMSVSERESIGVRLRQRMIIEFDWSLIALKYKEMFDYCLSKEDK